MMMMMMMHVRLKVTLAISEPMFNPKPLTLTAFLSLHFQYTLKIKDTVDGRNPAPVDRWFVPLFIGF